MRACTAWFGVGEGEGDTVEAVEWELVVEVWEAMLVAGAVVRLAVVVCSAGFGGPVLVEDDAVPLEV